MYELNQTVAENVGTLLTELREDVIKGLLDCLEINTSV